jgi:hypothetical protein
MAPAQTTRAEAPMRSAAAIHPRAGLSKNHPPVGTLAGDPHRTSGQQLRRPLCVPKTLSELMTWWNRLS